jgi:hypothetical protein
MKKNIDKDQKVKTDNITKIDDMIGLIKLISSLEDSQHGINMRNIDLHKATSKLLEILKNNMDLLFSLMLLYWVISGICFIVIFIKLFV